MPAENHPQGDAQMILIDTQPVAYRAWHAYDFRTSKGEPTNIICGVIKILRSILEKLPRSEPVIFWDMGKSRYRMSKYPEYKANRVGTREKPGFPEGSFHNQVSIVKEILHAMGVRQIWVQGVEADDLIAIASSTGDHIVVADDVDVWQLAQYGTKVYSPRREKWIDRDTCYNEIGCYPEQILDYKVLAGDNSDNIPGITGIGEKTAGAILSSCKTVPKLYEMIRSGERLPVGDKLRDRLISEEPRARLWYDIVQPLTWDMLDSAEQHEFQEKWSAQYPSNLPELMAIFDRWELKSFSEDLEGLLLAFGRQPSHGYLQPTGVQPEVKETPPCTLPDDWQQHMDVVRQGVLSCQECALRRECSSPVPGNTTGSSKPKVMMIGRNPGANEDRMGRGFVGDSGKRLDNWLAGKDAHGHRIYEGILDRSVTWVSNTAKCYSAGNRAPLQEEWSTCAARHLREEIKILQPNLILSFGAEAMTAITGLESVMKHAGTVIPGSEADGVVQYRLVAGQRVWDPIIPLGCAIIINPHPSAALRGNAAELKFQQCGRIVESWVRENI